MPRCRYCSNLYKPERPMQPGRVCNSVECQHKHSIEFLSLQGKKKAKAERIAQAIDRKTVKLKLDKLKPLSQWLREAQAACNAYVRERDKMLPCVSCGRFHSGAYDAGHYRSVGAAPSLRFDEANIHRQCVPCNQHRSGNIVEYRIGLLQRIGQAELDRIEGPLLVVKYTIDDAKRIKAYFVSKLRELKK